jgi:hypothetical protein
MILARLYVAGGVALLLMGAALIWQHDRHKLADAQRDRDTAISQLATAQAQSTLNQTAGTEAVKAEATAVRIITVHKEAARAVQAAPGASEALSPRMRADWLHGLNVLRDAGYSVPFPVDPNSPEPAGSVPKGG